MYVNICRALKWKSVFCPSESRFKVQKCTLILVDSQCHLNSGPITVSIFNMDGRGACIRVCVLICGPL